MPIVRTILIFPDIFLKKFPKVVKLLLQILKMKSLPLGWSLLLCSSIGIQVKYYPTRPDYYYTPNEYSGEALFLTPYIESGQILEGLL